MRNNLNRFLSVWICLAMIATGFLGIIDLVSENVKASGTLITLTDQKGGWGVDWTPDDQYALIVGNGGSVYKYDGTFSTIESGYNQNFYDVAWNPDSSKGYALIAGHEVIVKYDGESFETVYTGSQEYRKIGWKPDGSSALIVGEGNPIFLKWNGHSVEDLYLEFQNQMSFGPLPYSVCWRGDGSYALIGEYLGSADNSKMYTYKEGDIFERLTQHVDNNYGSVRGLQWKPGGDYFLLGASETIFRYDEISFSKMFISSGRVREIGWSDDSKIALIGTDNCVLVDYVNSIFSELSADPYWLTGIGWKNSNYALVVSPNGYVLKYIPPGQLTVEIECEPDVVSTADTSEVTVRVTCEGQPVENAYIQLTCDGGSLDPPDGYTDVNGLFVSTYCPPPLTGSETFGISGYATKEGYQDGSGYTEINVHPCLSVSIDVIPNKVVLGETAKCSSEVFYYRTNTPVYEAMATWGCFYGYFSLDETLTNENGYTETIYHAPNATSVEVERISVSISKSGTSGGRNETDIYLITPPIEAPELISPKDGIVLNYQPTLEWTLVKGALRHDIYVDTSYPIDTNLPYWHGESSINSTNPSVLLDGKYYWKVRSRNTTASTEEGWGQFSETWEFTLENATPNLIVNILGPEDIVLDSGTKLNLSIYIKDNGDYPVPGAYIQLFSSNGGTFDPQDGYTSSSGFFLSALFSPEVSEWTNLTITAMASKEGYRDGSDMLNISMRPPILPQLYVSISPIPTQPLDPGEEHSIVVHVSNGVDAVPSVDITLSSINGGSLNPSSGTTDSNGNFTSIFTAPKVSDQVVCRITAVASKEGYNNGVGYADIPVNALSLHVTVSTNPTALTSGQTSIITIYVTDGTNPVGGASVSLTSDNSGSFNPSTGTTDLNGDFRSTFTAPTVSTQTVCRITAIANKSGYNDGSDVVAIIVTLQPDSGITITDVKSFYSGFFMTDVDIINTYTAFVSNTDLSDPTDHVTFWMKSEEYIDSNPLDGWTAQYNMGNVGLNPTLTVIAYTTSGKASSPYVLSPQILYTPYWLSSFFFLIPPEITNLTSEDYDNIWELEVKIRIPDPPVDAFIDVPLPVVGGEYGLGISSEFGFNITSDRKITVFGGGDAIVKAASRGGRIGAIVQGKLDMTNDTIEWHSLSLNIDGRVDFIYEIPFELFGVGIRFGVRITPSASLEFYLVPSESGWEILPNLKLAFDRVEGYVGIGIDGYVSANVMVASIEGGLGGNAILTLKVPGPDYFQSLTLRAYAYAKITILFWSGEWASSWEWSTGGTTRAIPHRSYESTDSEDLNITDINWTLAERDYATSDYSQFVWQQDEDKGIFIHNVYPLAKPSIAVDENGNKMIMWTYDDINKPQQRSQEIYHSYYDAGIKEWTEPKALTSNNLIDFNPVVTFDDEGDAISVWQQIPNEIGTDVMSPFDILNSMELVYSVWNHETKTWSETKRITDNNEIDFMPSCGRVDGNIMLTFVSDTDGNPFTINDNSIYYCMWNGTDWSKPKIVVQKAQILTEPKVALMDKDNGMLVFSRDVDGNPESTNDREIYYVKYTDGDWTMAQRLTNDDKEDGYPSLVWVDGIGYISWIKKNVTIENDMPFDAIYMSKIVDGQMDLSSVVIQNSTIYYQQLLDDSLGSLHMIYQAGKNNTPCLLSYDIAEKKWGDASMIGDQEYYYDQLSADVNNGYIGVVNVRSKIGMKDLIPTRTRSDVYVLSLETLSKDTEKPFFTQPWFWGLSIAVITTIAITVSLNRKKKRKQNATRSKKFR